MTSAQCDLCNGPRARRFYLTVVVAGTKRGAGAIHLCELCWRSVSKGHRYVMRPDVCRRGLHRLTDDDVFIQKGYRRCRACDSASKRRYDARRYAARRAAGLIRGNHIDWTPERRRRQAEMTRAQWARRRAEKVA